MTKRNNATGILTILILTTLTGAAQSKPKVVFIGDQFTYSRSSRLLKKLHFACLILVSVGLQLFCSWIWQISMLC